MTTSYQPKNSTNDVCSIPKQPSPPPFSGSLISSLISTVEKVATIGRIIIEPEVRAKAFCPFGHNWDVKYSVERDQHKTHREGKRASYKFHTVVDVPNCPTCGHKRGALIPLQVGM